MARRRAEKGSYLAHPGDVEGKVPNAPTLAGLPECLALLVPVGRAAVRGGLRPRDVAEDLVPGPRRHRPRAAAPRRRRRAASSASCRVAAAHRRCRIVAAGDVLMHVRSRKPLQDTLTATRLGKPVAECGLALEPNAEQHLRSRGRLAALYEAEWLRATRCGSPAAAASRSTSCATSTRRRSCRRARRRPATCASSPTPARRRRFPRRGIAAARDVPAADRERARAHRAAASTRPTSSPSPTSSHWARAQEHPLPGPRQRRQFARLLLPRRHRGRPAPRHAAVRPLHQRRAQRAARHRHRLRAPAPRGGHPVHLRQVRPAPRRADRGGHQLPAALGAARRRPRARHRPAAHRRGRRRASTGSTAAASPPSGCARTASIPRRRWCSCGSSSPRS